MCSVDQGSENIAETSLYYRAVLARLEHWTTPAGGTLDYGQSSGCSGAARGRRCQILTPPRR